MLIPAEFKIIKMFLKERRSKYKLTYALFHNLFWFPCCEWTHRNWKSLVDIATVAQGWFTIMCSPKCLVMEIWFKVLEIHQHVYEPCAYTKHHTHTHTHSRTYSRSWWWACSCSLTSCISQNVPAAVGAVVGVGGAVGALRPTAAAPPGRGLAQQADPAEDHRAAGGRLGLKVCSSGEAGVREGVIDIINKCVCFLQLQAKYGEMKTGCDDAKRNLMEVRRRACVCVCVCVWTLCKMKKVKLLFPLILLRPKRTLRNWRTRWRV